MRNVGITMNRVICSLWVFALVAISSLKLTISDAADYTTMPVVSSVNTAELRAS